VGTGTVFELLYLRTEYTFLILKTFSFRCSALGTLYAFQKAAVLARELFQREILAELMDGTISIGLYHTAGKGTRLAPLPGSENNNKPGVKLPATVSVEGNAVPMTIPKRLSSRPAAMQRAAWDACPSSGAIRCSSPPLPWSTL
jgi:hypothetical protein